MQPGLRLDCGSVREALQNGAYFFLFIFRFGAFLCTTYLGTLGTLERWRVGVSGRVSGVQSSVT